MERLSKKTLKDYKQYPEMVLQFGEGNFLRGFVDWQIDKMNKEIEFNTGVVVVQPRAGGHAEKFNEQDGLYTLYLQGIKDGKPLSEHTIINCITRGINPYKNYSDYIKLAESKDLRYIFSNTTEAGLVFEEGEQLAEKPQKSFPGKLTAFLYHRFKVFNGSKDKGLIIIPCELVERNGDKLKEIVLRHAKCWNLEADFFTWIHEANTFCCSLVDRIVPGFPKDTINAIQDELGYKDNYVVVGEQYHLMVIEGPEWIKKEFPAHKAGLNVKVVDDIRPYGIRKVRILNGVHTAMTPVAYLYGLNTVGEAVEHEVIGEFVKQLIYEEIIPTMDLPEEELKSFANDVIERFRNPFVAHYLSSIALNSMSKFKTRDLPSLLEYVDRKGELPYKMVFSLSALILFYRGKRENNDIPLADDQNILDLYKSLWGSYDGSEFGLRKIVSSVLGYERLWERNLNELPGLTDAVTDHLIKIKNLGIKEAIKEVL